MSKKHAQSFENIWVTLAYILMIKYVLYSKYSLLVFIFYIKQLRQVGGVSYKDQAREILHVMFTDDLMAKMNLKGKKKLVLSTQTYGR